MRPLLVVNPASGGGRTGKTFSTMRATIEDALGPIDLAMTTRRGHATELARDAAKEARELVIGVGGDGTFNEVINGVMLGGATKTKVGLIAQGTGGDFRRALGIEHRLDRYLAALTSGRTRAIDVGKISYRARDGATREHFFVNILSAGMGGLVDRYVADTPAGVSGKAAYFGASLRALVKCQIGRLRCKVTLDGATETKKLSSYMIAICNGRYFGSGMHVAPMAKIDDGVFEVISMSAPSKVAFAIMARKIYDAGHIGQRGVDCFKCDKIELELENEAARDVFLLDCDGEPIGGLPVTIEVMKGALTLQA